MQQNIVIRPATMADLESFTDAVNSVYREKWYLATLDGYSLEQSRVFLQRFVDNSWPRVVAVSNGQVVGWCDITPDIKVGYTHIGRLGMGVRHSHRYRGIGQRLLETCVLLTRNLGLEKVELDAFADNTAAIRLYERHGFILEGIKTQTRKLEGKYQDIQLMARFLSGRKT